MFSDEAILTYIGGPTLLLEVAGLRVLTDPTFDPQGSEYKTAVYMLHKVKDPAVSLEELGAIDDVLLSHDHHFDNLDRSGRALLRNVEKVFTTPAGAERLGANAVGLAPWQDVEIPTRDGRFIRIAGTPARHGPANADRGPVTGFVLNFRDEEKGGVYISGDTVLYEGVAEVARRFSIATAILFMGAARVKEVGPQHLTMTAEEAVQAAKLFPEAVIVPVHFEGWEHYSESKREIERTFKDAGVAHRLHWLRAYQ